MQVVIDFSTDKKSLVNIVEVFLSFFITLTVSYLQKKKRHSEFNKSDALEVSYVFQTGSIQFIESSSVPY